MDITAYTVDASTPSLRMRALLDTGSMGPNMMASSLAKLTGHPIEELPEGFSYSPRVGNGQTLAPEGLVRVRWYFSERFSQAKSYDILFLVVPDTVMFDVVLGFKFLQAEHIFTMPSLFAMTGGQFVHDSTGKFASDWMAITTLTRNQKPKDVELKKLLDEGGKNKLVEDVKKSVDDETKRGEGERLSLDGE